MDRRTRSLASRLVLVVGLLIVVAVALLPLRVEVSGRRYDCGTVASSPFHYRQYPRLYGTEAGKACQRRLARYQLLDSGLLLGFGAAAAALDPVRSWARRS